MNAILSAVLTLGGLGIVFGLALTGASRLFAVEEDPRLERMLGMLPGANCGTCGYAGCTQLAQALLDDAAPIDACPVGGVKCAGAVAGILGVELKKNTRCTALVRCSGGVRAARKFEYAGVADCVAAMQIGGNGPMQCRYGCLGLGTCVSVCPFGAIAIRGGVAYVDHERCTACMKCAQACPKSLIARVPYYADVNVACSSQDRGGILRAVCEIGCLGCRICEKACKYGAITIVDALASIDYEKCAGCGACAESCPRKLIVDAKLDRGPGRELNAAVSEDKSIADI